MTEPTVAFDHLEVGGPAGREALALSRSPIKTSPIEKECAMKLTSAQVERTLSQFEAQTIPDDHPLVPRLNELFGDHTFFLDSNGLNIVEPAEPTQAGQSAKVVNVVNLASWSDADPPSLAPHEPEPTDVVVVLAVQ
jgi:hypothetical protein